MINKFFKGKPEIEVVQEAMHLEDSGELTKAVCTVNNMNRNFDYEVFWSVYEFVMFLTIESRLH